MSCLICRKKNFVQIWFGPIRSGSNKFTNKKERILKCLNCDLIFLKDKRKFLENSSLTRNIFNKNNSIKEFKKFHRPRELSKLNHLKKFVSFKNKSVLESNCGAGLILDEVCKDSKSTTGLDDIFYKDYFIKKNKHNFYKSADQIISNKIKFDIILSLSEIEHKYDPVIFLNKLKKMMTKKSFLILRIPNYNNIYYYLLGNDYLKFDYRISHNFYFSEKNLDMLFKKLKFKIFSKSGFNEYSSNHLLTYMERRKRVPMSDIKNYLTKSQDRMIQKNIESSLSSTSLIYILKI